MNGCAARSPGWRTIRSGRLSSVRLSGGSPALWAGIAHDNARAVDAALAGVERQLQTIRAALATGDVAALRASLVAARDWFVRDDRDGRDSSGESPAPPE